MNKNTGIPYEILTKTIFNEIVNQNSVETIKVLHDVVLNGRDSKHQIDVFWEFKHAGIKYCTVIQAKDWQSRVKQEQLFTFKQVLQDLPNQPRGIFVTKTGYQKGAFNFAKKNGIELFELREFTKEDEDGRIKTVILNLHAYLPHSKVLNFELDNGWVHSYAKKNKIKGDFEISISGDPKDMVLLNKDGEIIQTIETVVNKLYPEDFKEMPVTQKIIELEDSTFIHTTCEAIPLVKIKKIFIEISVSKTCIENKIVFDDVVSFILKNVVTKEERLITKDLKLLR